MSNRRRPVRPSVNPPETLLKVRDPGDLLAAVPYRLGFHPEHSLVVMALHGPRRRFGFSARVDLPPVAKVPDLARYLVEILRRHDADEVLLVAYATDDAVAGLLVDTLLQWLPRHGIDVLDAYRADGERWFCYTCDDACCPADGTPYDLSGHPLVAELVLAGQVALADRDAVQAQVAPVAGPRRDAMTAAFADAAEQMRVAREGTEAGPDVVGTTTWVRSRVERWLADPRTLGDDELAELAVAVASLPARDTAWMLMTRDTAAGHRRLWQQVLAGVVPPFEPAVACLTAFAAWLEGQGALAWCAAERALAADPTYSWAHLIVEMLEQAVSPEVWQSFPPDEIERLVG